MMIRFDSKVGGFAMFDDVAVQLLKLMGHSGTVPGAILAADIPPALARLKAAVAAAPEAAAKPGRDSDDKAENVPLARRAYPLIDLLERAATLHCDVLWDRQ